VARRVAVVRRRRSRMRGRTRPRTVARRCWGRWTGPPDAGPRAADPQHETGRGAGPVDDPRGCVVSLAGSSCHPSLSVEVPPLVCCPSPRERATPYVAPPITRLPVSFCGGMHRLQQFRRHCDMKAQHALVMQQRGRRSPAASSTNITTAHPKACCGGVSTPMAPPCRGPLRFDGPAESGPAVKESRFASDHLTFRHRRWWPRFARTGSPTTRAGQMT
jgi:hypothetical protein